MGEFHYNREDVHSTLNNIVTHPIFASSSRAIDFLKYIIDRVLENRADEINGTTIAQDVFGKGAEFDASQDASVRVYARRLRALLEEYYTKHPSRDPVIITIPKGGYKPLIEKNTAFETFKSIQHSAAPASHNHSTRFKVPVWFKFFALPSLLFIGVIFVVSMSKPSLPSGLPTSTPEALRHSAVSYPKIAVTAFENETGIENYDFLEEALQVKLVEDLSRFNFIRPSIYEGRYEAIRSEGPNSHDYAISGIVLSVEPTLDLYIKLIDVKNSTLLYARRVKRANDNSDYFDSISKIVSDLSGNVAGLEGAIVKNRLNAIQKKINQDTLIVSNLPAFECYAQLRSLIETPNPEIYNRLYTCLSNLLEKDPDNATLLTAFGWVTYNGAISHEPVFMARSVNPDIKADDGIAMMKRAVQIDPDNAEAHQNLSAYKSIIGDVQGALQHAEMAAMLNPGNPDNIAWLGRCLLTVGEWDRARMYAQEALDRNTDPSSEYYRTFFYLALNNSDMEGMKGAADKLVATNDYYANIFSALAAAANDDEATLARLRPEIQIMAARNNNDIMYVMKTIMQSDSLNAKVQDLFIKGGIIVPQISDNSAFIPE